ncbi:hypothetical protein AB1Y20_018658 [Prymnesium parvum]|uniref:Uncharacterized protein n=1 Tax=Prymnesium parvum TaxID=97485 RepID=A0AB34JP69_PRYPA
MAADTSPRQLSSPACSSLDDDEQPAIVPHSDEGSDCFLRIRFTWHTQPEFQIDAKQMELAASLAARSFFGEVGGTMKMELVWHNASEQEAVLRIAKCCLIRIWSSLTLLTEFEEKLCTVDVLKVSDNPAALGIDGVEMSKTAARNDSMASEALAGPVGSEFVSVL